MNTYRTCHNKRCRRPFNKLRVNQKHCDTICKERCLECKKKHYDVRKSKLRQLRKERAVG